MHNLKVFSDLVGKIYETTTNPAEWRANVTQLSNAQGGPVDGTDAWQLSAAELDGRRQAVNFVRFLREFAPGFEQAYLLLGSAPIEGRLSGVVDIPNSCSTVYIPTAIFDFDVRPSAAGPYQIDPGMGAPMASA